MHSGAVRVVRSSRRTGCREIHVYARICALVDVYDALTSDRPYRGKMPPFRALNLIKERLYDRTQKELFENLVMVLGEN